MTRHEAIQFFQDLDAATGRLLNFLREHGEARQPLNNVQICQEALKTLESQSQQLRSLRECCDKQVTWIKAAMNAMHPECEVTSDPESLRGKTFVLTPKLSVLESWTLEERNAILQLSTRQDMSPANVLKQALRHYQASVINTVPNASRNGGGIGAWGCADLSMPQEEKDHASQFVTPYQMQTGVHWDGVKRDKIAASQTQQLEDLPTKKVPLEALDLPLGTAISFTSDSKSEFLITGRNKQHVWLGSATKGVDGTYLMNEGGEYRLPGSNEWKPCYKLVPNTPTPATA